jgi:trk system potassium uptake protein TrkH
MGIVAPGSSLTTIAGVPIVNITIMVLIITGGLGFFLWDDLFTHRFHVREYRLHTKIVLVTTSILLVSGTLAFYFIERHHAFSAFPEKQKWLMAAFQAVTPRTAGFNSVKLKSLSDSSTFLTIFLMFVGAASGSTGGGIKVNTFAVVVLSVIIYAMRGDSVNAFHRRLDDETIHKAFSASGLYLGSCLTGSFILCLQGFSMRDSLFEVFSAMGTVGLTRGITPLLPVLSKIVVIILMYFGRLGSLSVALAMSGQRERPHFHNISEEILIG